MATIAAEREAARAKTARLRAQRLAQSLEDQPPKQVADPLCPIHNSDHYEGSGRLLLKAAERIGVEGIVSKKLDSRYVSGPSKAWLETKCWASGDFVVIGTEPRNGGQPLALLAREDEGGLVYAGSAFVTLGHPERDQFWSRTTELACAKSAFPHLRNSKASWCRPRLRVQVRYLRGGGLLRHAVVGGICGERD